MRGVFGDTLLAYQKSVNSKDKNNQALKKITAELAVMVLEMDPIKRYIVNVIHRLIENNISITTVKQDSPCETGIWSMFSDPILRSLFSIPDQNVHLRCTISSGSQLQWSRDSPGSFSSAIDPAFSIPAPRSPLPTTTTTATINTSSLTIAPPTPVSYYNDPSVLYANHPSSMHSSSHIN
ncbi:hypothetical protein BDA99DRAFT_561545 [Phascolomyces articulosus]|uniref:Uncharacterized protein n=1 Tax=Phascolomyces articulosus TaxID=60185 RepID=A0AAD5PC74_9FUNG|nr:hypothetical protein BDA99DRAFT_561545 [Phascolomyces articulosus]